jgi:hypothetical protein
LTRNRAVLAGGECLSTTFYSFRNSSVVSANYSATRTCNSYTGFCDGQGQCQMVQTHDAVNSFTDLFSPANIKKAANFIREYWYYFAAGAGTLLAINIGLCCVNHFESRSIDSLVNKRRKMVRIQPPENCMRTVNCLAWSKI